MKLEGLLDAVEAADEVERRHDDYAVYRFPWLPVQLAFLMDPSRAKDCRTGNQGLGKTTAGLAEDIFYALGSHPFRWVPPPPCRIRIICATAVQSIEIQEKLWYLVPKSELVPGVEFRTGQGFRGRDPKRVAFKNGSLITFHTSYQSAIAQAGGTVDRIHFDEPPKNDRVFVEARNRMIKTGGTLILTFAPVNAPVDYLRELIAKGELSDHHSPMTQAAMTPVPDIETVSGLARSFALERGDPHPSSRDVDQAIEAWLAQRRGMVLQPITDKFGRPFTDEYIAELKRGVPAYQVPVVFDGEWEFYTVDRVFDQYDPLKHELGHDEFWREVIAAAQRCERAGTHLKLGLGGDHGDGDHKSVSWPLVAVEDHGPHPRLYVLDEYVSDGSTTTDMDALSILDLLARNGQRWAGLDSAVGDRPWLADDKGKSNLAIMRHLARELGLGSWRDLRPTIRQAKSGGFQARGSVDTGIRFLHEAMIRPRHLIVNRDRCPNLSTAFLRWDRRPKSEHVHILDGLRYATLPWQTPNAGSGIAVVRNPW